MEGEKGEEENDDESDDEANNYYIIVLGGEGCVSGSILVVCEGFATWCLERSSVLLCMRGV